MGVYIVEKCRIYNSATDAKFTFPKCFFTTRYQAFQYIEQDLNVSDKPRLAESKIKVTIEDYKVKVEFYNPYDILIDETTYQIIKLKRYLGNV